MNHLILALLLLVQSPNGTVTGRLLTASGTPAIGVRVTAMSVVDTVVPASSGVLASISQTDSAGRYRLENVPPGRYYITAGLVGSPTYFPGTSVIGGATAFDVKAGSTASVPDFSVLQASLVQAASARIGPTPPDPWYRLLPKLAEPVALNVGLDARSSYEAIGKIVGVPVLFDRRFVPGAPVPVRVQGLDAFGALKLLSAQTGNDWAVFGRDAIMVVPTGQGVRDVDIQLPSRDVTAAAVYPGFQPKATGPLSFDIKAESAVAFETIASASGLTVVFEPNYRGMAIRLKLENADVYSALDILSGQVGAFWVPYDSSTIVVSNDNVTKHRLYDLQVVKMYYPSNLKTSKELIDAVEIVRKTLRPRAYFAVPTANAILIGDTPSTIALADKLIAELDKTQTVRATAEMMDSTGNLFVLEPAGPRNVTPYRSELQPRPGLFSIDVTLPTRQVFEKVAELGGIKVVFDSNLRTFSPSQLQLKLSDVDFFKALDMMALQTQTFWFPLDNKTIFVAADNTTNRRDYEPTVVKTFYPNVTTVQEFYGVANVAGLTLNLTNALSNPHAKAITIRDSPLRMALAEMLITQLNSTTSVRASAELETYAITNALIRDFTGRHTLTPVRSQLKPDVSGPVSLQMNGNVRDTYEALAKAAGVQVTFDSSVVPRGPVAFHVDNKNIFDALSILSYQTRTFWRVVDSKTIQVGLATNAIRGVLEPKIQKSVSLLNVRSPQDIDNIVSTVRQILNFQTGIAPNASMTAIEMTETAEKVAVAEALIRNLDVP